MLSGTPAEYSNATWYLGLMGMLGFVEMRTNARDPLEDAKHGPHILSIGWRLVLLNHIGSLLRCRIHRATYVPRNVVREDARVNHSERINALDP